MSHALKSPIFAVASIGCIVAGNTALGEDLLGILPFQPQNINIAAVDEDFGQPPGGCAIPGIVAEAGRVGVNEGWANFVLQWDFSRVFRADATSVHNPKNPWLRQRLYEGIHEHFPPVHLGDQFPIFGALYRVHRCQPVGNIGAEIGLTRIPPEQYPSGVTFDPYGYTVCVNGSVSPEGSLIRCSYNEAQRQLVLNIKDSEYAYQEDGVFRTTKRDRTITPSVGDLVTISVPRRIDFRVLAIVKPDPATQILGWVELRRLWPRIVPFGIDEDIDVR